MSLLVNKVKTGTIVKEADGLLGVEKMMIN